MPIAPPEPPYIPARHHGGTQVPKAIVVHCTVSPCKPGGAYLIARMFAQTSTPKSAHYTVDPSATYQSVYDHTVAYHCGYNAGSIAVELCDPQTGPGGRWRDDNHKAMLDRAAELVARLCLAYHISIGRPTIDQLKAKGPHGIYGHDDSRRAFGRTTHTDPGIGFPWDDFLTLVRQHADRLNGTQPAERHATANIKSNPLMLLPKARADILAVASGAGVVGWQELHPTYEVAVKHLRGFNTYWPGGAANAVAISWRRRRYEFVASGKKLTHLGIRGVTPRRYVVWVVLRDRVTGETFWRVNTHYISGAWKGALSKQPRLRRPLWSRHDKILAALVEKLIEQYGPGVVGGDFNRAIGSPLLNSLGARVGARHESHSWDHLYVFGGEMTSAKRTALWSDHDALTTRVTFN